MRLDVQSRNVNAVRAHLHYVRASGPRCVCLAPWRGAPVNLASFPGLRGGRGRPGTHCARMRVIIASKRTVGVHSKRHN